MSVFSCRRAAELTSKVLDTPLRVGERISLGAHRLICSACRRFHGQIATVDQSFEDFLTRDGESVDSPLPETARQRIRKELARLSGTAPESPDTAKNDSPPG